MTRKTPTTSSLLTLAALALVTPVASADGLAALEQERRAQSGTAITIIFDDSMSMKGEKMSQAKAAFAKWLSSAPAGYRYSLITFPRKLNVDFPKPDKSSPEGLAAHKQRVLAAVRAARAHSRTTTLCDGLDIAQSEIRRRRKEYSPYERHVVLLFTDGQETGNSEGNDGVKRRILKLRREQIEVVGIAFHGEGDYMNGTATRFFEAGNQAELAAGLSQVDAEPGTDHEIEVSEAELGAMKASRDPLPPAPGLEHTAKRTPFTRAPTSWGSPLQWMIGLGALLFAFSWGRKAFESVFGKAA